jgi:formamidopyrimidine-DNA glycosylase
LQDTNGSVDVELPELTILGRQMRKEIVGKRVYEVGIANPKCLNMTFEQFKKTVVGKTVKSVESRGKWLFIKLNSHQLLFNPGMGADVIHFESNDKLPEKYQIKFDLEDGTGFTIRVWWFCYLHLMPEKKLGEHKLTAKLGITPLDKRFTLDYFKQLLSQKRGNIKSFLLDQSKASPQKKDTLNHRHGDRCFTQIHQISVERKHRTRRISLRKRFLRQQRRLWQGTIQNRL